MKIKWSLLFLALCLVGEAAQSAPYYRFWRGWKNQTVNGFPQTYDAFAMNLNKIFIPATVDYGAGHGLVSYQPILGLSPEALYHGRELGIDFPDEVALVAYESEGVYDHLRNTPKGDAYAALHGIYFNTVKSKSLVPQAFDGQVTPGSAFDVLLSDESWMKTASRGRDARFAVYIRAREIDDQSYYSTLNQFLSAVQQGGGARGGLLSHVVLVTDQYWIEFRLWRSHDDASRFERTNMASALGFLAMGKIDIPILEYVMGEPPGKAPSNFNLTYGRGASVRFEGGFTFLQK